MKKHLLLITAMIASISACSQSNIFPENVNIGLGTTNPLFALDIAKPGDNISIHLKKTDATTASWYIHSGRLGGGEFSIGDDLQYRMVILPGGNIGIGTIIPKEKLSVNGKIRAQEVKVEADNWPDYVFRHSYKLSSLPELKSYIDQHQHLPEMPSEQEVAKNGIDLGEMNKLLVKKVEELTLYLIDQDKQMQEKYQLQSETYQSQQQQIDQLKAQLALLINK